MQSETMTSRTMAIYVQTEVNELSPREGVLSAHVLGELSAQQWLVVVAQHNRGHRAIKEQNFAGFDARNERKISHSQRFVLNCPGVQYLFISRSGRMNARSTATLSMNDMFTINHEMANIQYYMSYKDKTLS
ncbi:hypothetical protein BpHYR1_050382 [Brachionus plicatilis]|uniref:Uncharacterized protein n=1 Tax=Brachionus plicatilis TaxID=10195 RepID=A0A3M7STM3_BRAPC|nr:hypothetical protein BpHYR1_050382 [Brachionus plicatilis]